LKEVRNKLMEEVKTLEHELRVQLPKEIKTALAMGDLRENAEYHAALDRQGFVKARIPGTVWESGPPWPCWISTPTRS
jgi:transcription elongation factor GreA